jgi:hypothetical protein
VISYVITGAAAMLIGMASGQAIVLSAGRRRLSYQVKAVGGQISELVSQVNELKEQVPTMISRAEVERAFAQVAQIEAQRQAATVQQARAQAVFGGSRGAGATAELNTAINAQLNSLTDRINRINQEFGVG